MKEPRKTWDGNDGPSYISHSHVGEDPKTALHRIGEVSSPPLTELGKSFKDAVLDVFHEAFKR